MLLPLVLPLYWVDVLCRPQLVHTLFHLLVDVLQNFIVKLIEFFTVLCEEPNLVWHLNIV
jgi:hypothetical protein